MARVAGQQLDRQLDVNRPSKADTWTCVVKPNAAEDVSCLMDIEGNLCDRRIAAQRRQRRGNSLGRQDDTVEQVR